MNAILWGLAAGLIFGIGLVISGMTNPAKVLNFLDVAGTWDPSLAFVMGGAVLTTAIGYRFALAQSGPILAMRFSLPTATMPDARLILGAALFGIGWGLAGLCPGPALASLASGTGPVLTFCLAMFGGMWLARLAERANKSRDVRVDAQAAAEQSVSKGTR